MAKGFAQWEGIDLDKILPSGQAYFYSFSVINGSCARPRVRAA